MSIVNRSGPILLAAAVALLLGCGATAMARTHNVAYQRCPHGHATVRDSAGQKLTARNLRVSEISCSRAKAALKRATFAATPGGPEFSTPGFMCGGPVGPPPPHSKPRYYHCTRGRGTFEFLVPGFS